MAVIQLRYSTVSGHIPTGLANGQFAINIVDGILFWVNSGSVLQSFNFASPSVTTMGGSDNSVHAANTAFVAGQIAALINGAPAELNTLAEIAAAINNDPLFYKTMNNILVNCVRGDITQSFNGTAQALAQANIGLSTAIINGGTF